MLRLEPLADLWNCVGIEERVVERILVAMKVCGGRIVPLVEAAAVIVARLRCLFRRLYRRVPLKS